MRDVDAARMSFDRDGDVRVTSRLKDVLEHVENQAEYHIGGISAVNKAAVE